MIISNLSKPELKSDRKRYTNMTLQALLLYFLIGLIVISVLGIVNESIQYYFIILYLKYNIIFFALFYIFNT